MPWFNGPPSGCWHNAYAAPAFFPSGPGAGSYADDELVFGSWKPNFEKSTGLPSYNYPNIKVARVDLIHPDSNPEQWMVAVPKDMDRGLCFFSPSGDRILWVGNGDVTSPLLRMLRRYIPGMSSSPAAGYHWLISGIHGEDMHEIASYRYDPRQTIEDLRELYSDPVWMPDSRHISFIFHDTLYTRPIE